MHRRNFLAGATAVGAGAVLSATPAGAAPAGDTIEDVLFGRLTAEPLPAQQLRAQIAAAGAAHRAARYTRLARRLPRLLAQAVASRSAAGVHEHAAASERLAEAYGVATQLLIKLHGNGMACATGRGRPSAAFDALLAAEHDVPEEVRYRPRAQQLTRELLSCPESHGLSGVREFAARVGVA